MIRKYTKGTINKLFSKSSKEQDVKPKPVEVDEPIVLKPRKPKAK
jgi:hypothetical protein